MRLSPLFLVLLATAASADPGQVVLGPARFTVIAPECVRLEYQPDGKFIDAPSLFAANREARDTDATISSSPTRVEIDTGRIHLVYQPDGQPFSARNLSADIAGGGTWTPGQASTGNLGGTLHSLDYVQAPQDLGEGVLSRDGWYLLDDSARALIASSPALGTPDGFGDTWIAARPAGSGTDWYLFGYGQDYAAGLRALTTIGGPVPLPRKYVLGSWYSRWWKYSSNDYREIVKEFHEHDFPLDVLVWDMYWHIDGWTGYSWNRSLLPDAEKLLQELHAENIHVPLNDHPASGIQPAETMYAGFMRAMGQDPASKAVIPYDAGNRRYLDTAFQYAQSAREKDGADFWWLDWMGSESAPFNQLPWLNEYYYRHSEANGLRGQDFARWGDWGDHRHPINFSGDTYADWWMLQYQVPFTATAGNVGAFYWSHDVGGFMSVSSLGNLGSEPAELLARWAQFGALSPILRLHSTQDPNLDKRPWLWGADVESSMHSSFHLRAELVPYLYSTAWEAHHDSLPLMRPLYLDSPAESEAYANLQEYELGDALLAAPVTHAGAGSGHVATQAVWFPPSSKRWYRWDSGELYQGGAQQLITSDLIEAPLFARGGVPVLLQPYNERPGTAALSTLVVRAYPGDDGQVSSAVLYEDDGETKAYETGADALTPVTYQRSGNQMSIELQPTIGSFTGQLAQRGAQLEFPATQKAEGAWLNGTPIAFTYDAPTSTNTVTIPPQAIHEAALVTIQAEEADPAAAARAAQARRTAGASGDAATLLAIQGQGIATRGTTGLEVFPGAKGATVQITDVAGDVSRNVLSTTCASSVCAYDPGPPADDGTFPLGMTIARTATVTLAEPHQKLKQVLSQASTDLRAWSWVGPFDFDITKSVTAQAYPPETESRINLRETYTGSGKQTLSWAPVTTGADGAVNLFPLVPQADHKLAYAVSYLHSDAQQGIRLGIQADDAIEVFLDGIQIYALDGQHDVDQPASYVLAGLPPGDHELLLKIANFTGGWGFRVSAETGAPITVSANPW